MSEHRVEAPISSRFGKTLVRVPRGFVEAETGRPSLYVVAQVRDNSMRIHHTPHSWEAYDVRDAWHVGHYEVPGDLRSLDLPATAPGYETPLHAGALALSL